MLKRWLLARKSLVATATSGTLIAAIVATLAVVSGGYDAQRLDLGDGSVWVANGSQQVIGRANTGILALDTVVEGPGSDLQVVQDGSTVLRVDHARGTVDVVDVAMAETSESIVLPPESPDLLLAADTVVIHSSVTGSAWILPVGDLPDFDATAEPTLSLGADSVVSASAGGTVFFYSRESREVYLVDAADGEDVVATFPADLFSAESETSITSVAGQWVLLDPKSAALSIGGRVVDLSATVDDEQDLVLQGASDTGDRVLVGYGGGLVAVPLAGGAPERIAEAGGGIAAPPAVIGECAFAAWSSGLAWRECVGDSAATLLSLEAVPAGASGLAFVANGTRVVLNDPLGGGTWTVQGRGELIDNWDELIADDERRQEVEERTDDAPPDFAPDQLPPVAIDDEFGARSGRANVLPVLLNDYDPNGDVLVVEAVEGVDDSVGRIDVIGDRQKVQLTLTDGASGPVTLRYTVSDGRGGSANATVTVTVRANDENSPPVQVRESRALVAGGDRVTANVLGDWVDPDGDAFYLTSSTTAAPDTVTHRPGGTVVFHEAGSDGGARTVTLAMSDGRATGSGSLVVAVRSVGEVPIVADAFVVLSYAGQETVVRPLEHVRGGTGELSLASVPPRPGTSIEVRAESGTFRFTSDQVRTHNLEYVVSDGDQTVTGTIRVDVQAPPEANSTPITTPKTIFVGTLSSEIIDITATDIDPAGGVLLVTGVSEVPGGAGVSATVLEQRAVRVTLTAPLDSGPVTFGYRVSNGLAEADGVITVVEIPRPTTLQPPVASDDTVTVRLGDAIDIPVLENDAHPDGEALTLSPTLPTGLSRASGVLFAAGGVLRYLAPAKSGNFTAVYEVAGPDGQVDQAEVNIAVREAVAATNSAPVPPPVVGRVVGGEVVRITIPLSGTDPDGDSVRLLGQETSPEKGSVIGVGPDYIDFRAGDYSAGTDGFTYRVIDALGMRAVGTVTIGIRPKSGGAGNPIAVEDEVRVRPGKTVSVQVLANDSDPDGGQLTVVGVEPNSPDIAWEIVDDVVAVTPPVAPGRYGLVYTIENASGGSSSNFVTVVVDPETPPTYPVARDTVLTLSDIADRDVVSVDVLRNVFFAEGDVGSLSLALLPGFDGRAAIERGRIEISVAERRQIIPFAVANPDDPSAVAYAFVWVPGFEDALPQLDRDAPVLRVPSGSPLRIDLNDHVIAVDGREVLLVDSATVEASNANGAALVVDETTLSYTSADGYFGPASISFEVTDGETVSDQQGRRAIIVLPIEVTPRENQPPAFTGGVVDFEPGEEKTLDLLRLTSYPYPDDLDELVYSAGPTPPAGFEYTITGTTLVIRAKGDAATGTSSALTIGVRDSMAAGPSGRIRLQVVPSTRPLARPAADPVVAPRGTTTVIDPLENDQATNPFPGEPLRVVAIRGIDGQEVPDGVTVTPDATNSRLTVTVSASAAPIDTNLQYQVADATGDPGRYTYGAITISVQDRPGAPAAPTRADGGFEEGLVTLRLAAPPSNNSPITKYEVVSTSNGGYRKDCGATLLCELTDLTPGLRYQFAVIATNAIGASDPGGASIPLSADYLPAAPAQVTATARAENARPSLGISWSGVVDPAPGTAVTGYVVRVTGPGVDFETTVGPQTTSITTTAGGGLTAKSQYAVTVFARNAALVLGDGDWRRSSSAPVTAVGAPSGVAGGVAAVVVNGSTGEIRVTWGASDPGGAPAVSYSVGRFGAGDTVPQSCTPGGERPGVAAGAAAPVASGWVDTAASDGTAYRYVVYADNGLFCTPSSSGSIESKSPPGATVASTSVEQRDGRYDLRVATLAASAGMASRFEGRLNGSGDWFAVAEGQWLTSAANAGVYGTAQSIQYRACRDAGPFFCGAPSASESLAPVNARGAIVSCVVGTVPTSNPPANAGQPSHEYLYSYNDGSAFGNWTAFAPDETAPDPALVGSGMTEVRLRVAVTFSDGSRYTDDGYAQDTCGPRP